ncbi:probable tubulin polyglutamylase ttll-15 [Chironomus tepperi]|uniref:probable tubulin polyglutamylase ttll-15 n=1 Tax=Chironomus tepperi TaxID=113505 RepID=UPI00391F66FE
MPKKNDKRVSEDSSLNTYIIIFLVSIIIILLSVLIAFLIKPKDNESKATESANLVEKEEFKRLRFWSVVIDVWNQAGHFRTMNRVFENLQYKFVNASHGDDWDILWAIENPFYIPEFKTDALFMNVNEHPLRIEQKANHFPGIGLLVGKSHMNYMNAHLKYILPSFVLPHDETRFKEFLAKNPKVKLVEKNIYNRGVHIVTKKDVLQRKHDEDSEIFFQQFMDKPFLIDGHAFDFGIFVLITSFNPLRIYRFDADVLFRFCIEEYYPFDPSNRDKYVVQSGCLPAYEMPTFQKVLENYQYTSKQIFENYIEEKGYDVKSLWSKIDDAIVKIVMNTEPNVINRTKSFNYSTHNFFELVRFDIIFDENLEPYVMEVNMSPNLTPAEERYEENALIYEQLIYNTVHMIGGGSYFEFMSRFNDSDVMVANRKNIAVDVESCLKDECYKSCEHPSCKLCSPCVKAENRYQMREAFREHLYEGNLRRLFPSKIFYEDKELYDTLTENNQFSVDWYRAKCLEDEKWC